MRKAAHKITAFDFDGVLFDSKRECLEVALEACGTHEKWRVSEKWRKDSPDFPRMRDFFYQYRYLVGPPWQYALLLKLIDTDQFDVLNTAAFDLRAKQSLQEYQAFTEHFFAVRHRIMADGDRWPKLMEPYPEAAHFFRAEYQRSAVKILSTRDPESIKAAIRYHLSISLDSTEFLERAGVRTKADILQSYRNQEGFDSSDILFLEDHILHALPALEAGFDVFLCEWGYLTADELAEARTRGLPTLALKALDKLHLRSAP